MTTRTGLCLLLFVMPLMVFSAKKGKNERKSPPQWKSSSMPGMNKRFESIFEGKDLNLDCKAQAHPKPNVKWLKDGVELKNSNNIEVKKFNLVLKTVTSDMSGNYTCVISNKHGQIDWTFHLDIQVKIWPLIIEGPNNITQMVGSNVAFRCRVLNDPKATIRWQKTYSSKNIEENVPQAEFLPDSDDSHVLTMDNIQKGDEGEYRCMAGNVWGLKYSSAWLTVIEPVLVPDVPRLPEMGKKGRNNNINSNNVVEPELHEKLDAFDPNESDNMDMDNSLYDGGYNPEGLDPSDYGPDLYFTTTKRPKNRKNNRRKNERKKDRKGKDQIFIGKDVAVATAVDSMKVQSTTTMDNFVKTSYPNIWSFEDSNNNYDEVGDTRSNNNYDEVGDTRSNNNYDEVSDTRYNPIKTDIDESAEAGDTISSNSDTDEFLEGSISSWTIYTVVGAVGGVILLIGLVAITLTLCCKKEENSVFKSTPV